jgi:ABC-type nickel/cobalt efflux system permease component RcnA
MGVALAGTEGVAVASRAAVSEGRGVAVAVHWGVGRVVAVAWGLRMAVAWVGAAVVAARDGAAAVRGVEQAANRHRAANKPSSGAECLFTVSYSL